MSDDDNVEAGPGHNGPDKDTFLRFLRGVSETKQDLADAQTTNASEWKRAEQLSINKAAAKQIISLNNMDESKREDFLRSFWMYCAYMNWYPQKWRDLIDQADAVSSSADDFWPRTLALFQEQINADDSPEMCICVVQAGDRWISFGTSALALRDASDLDEKQTETIAIDGSDYRKIEIPGPFIKQAIANAVNEGFTVLQVDARGQRALHENTAHDEEDTPAAAE